MLPDASRVSAGKDKDKNFLFDCQLNEKAPAIVHSPLPGLTLHPPKISFKELYNRSRDHRNRLAHNTCSYQENLPSLDLLKRPVVVYDNLFFRLFILIFTDGIFRELYHSLQELYRQHNYV